MRNEKGSKGNYGKVKATPQNNKRANKLPKPSKHHDVKPKKKKGFTSIKERMQLVQRNSQSSRAHTHKGFKTGYSFSKANSPEHNLKSTKPTQKKKKKGAKKRAFQMNIPQSNEIFLKRVDVPWYNSSQANANAESFNDKSRLKNADDQDSDDDDTDNQDMALLQLPPESILSSIDSDIASFCAYIKLGPVELKARQAFLDEITGIALNQFGKGGRNRNNRASGTEDEISVVPFGSFATQSVCTFASDVDMCLWGVVKGEKQPEHTTFVDDDTDASQRDADILEKGQRQQDECPLLTESSLLRTMEAIQNSCNGENKTERKKDAPKSEKKEKAQSHPENDNNDLFFIDRVGELIDDSEKQGNNLYDKSAIAESKPAPKKGFQFEIDLAGVKELGGDVDGLNECTQPDVKKDQTKESESTEVHEKPSALAKTEQPGVAVCNNNDKAQNAQAQTIQPAGKTKETAIEVDDNDDDDDGSKSDVIVIDSDDDDDDADKMASYYSRQSNTSATDHLNRNNTSSPINLLHSDGSSCKSPQIEIDSSNDDDDDSRKLPQEQEDEVMELSLTSGRTSTQQPLTKPVIGPTGKTRNKVVSVLLSLTNQLRRSSFTHTIECRSRARVPIINCSTRTGFEGDIAIGGHNGLDTSTYARSQVNRFNR